MRKHYDAILVGAGLYNAVLATRLIKEGKSVLVIEKRSHIAGNCYSERMDNIDVHVYGPHIFHTSNKEVWDFVNQYAEFNTFQLNTMAMADGQVYNLPFNMNTFAKVFGVSTPEETQQIIDAEKENIENPKNLEEQAISMVGRTIYEKFIKGYTEKQWGKKCTELPPEIIKRIPLRFTYNNNYFNDIYQGIPKDGYTAMIEKMFEGCDILLNTDFLAEKEKWEKKADLIFYSGCIDEYYNYQFGELEYRGLKFKTKRVKKDNIQGCPVMNYTTHEQDYTRKIEHKWFNPNNESNFTYITEEYPAKWEKGEIPYYPVNTKNNQFLYTYYKNIKNSKVKFTGRLGMYKYMDMDDVVESALQFDLSKQVYNNEIIYNEKYNSIGKQYNGEKAIISLTSWKARINTVSKTLMSLIQQCPGFHIVLVLSEEEFPLKEKELPENLMLFVDNELIEILWVYKNYKSFKKILFTMDKYRDVPIISADDDCIYKCNYAEVFYNNWLEDKNSFYSCYLSEKNKVPHLGGAATLYPPYIFKNIGIKILNESKLYLYTNQDDDFYTALRYKLELYKAKKVLDYKKIYKFHDEFIPCHDELKKMTIKERNELTNIIISIVYNFK